MEGQLVNFGPGSDPGPSGHPIDPVAVVHPDLGELATFSAVIVPSVGSVEELNPIERNGQKVPLLVPMSWWRTSLV